MPITDVVACLYAVHASTFCGFADFPGMQSLKCGNSNRGGPGLEHFCYCVDQSIIFLAVFYSIKYEPFPFSWWEQSVDWMCRLLELGWLNYSSKFSLHSLNNLAETDQTKTSCSLIQLIEDMRGKEPEWEEVLLKVVEWKLGIGMRSYRNNNLWIIFEVCSC